ncbi:MAG: cysteine desulfurase [Candidatus Hydrogenedentes bacterium]|nr:cysteine desulfurase [Candidatus Hydrogenedentota bacterium]
MTSRNPQSPSGSVALDALDAAVLKKDFPILAVRPYGKPLVYLDNAATGQKPQCVIDATSTYYAAQNANVHRGIHYLSEIATREYDATREKVRHFFNAAHTHEIVFTSGNTEAINLVAHSFGRAFFGEGDEIILSEMEHHSNIVPWQLLREQIGVVLKIIPVDDRGDLILEEYEKLLSPKTKLVAIVYVSNALGTVNPVEHIIEKAHAQGVPVLLDSAQVAPHMTIDVQALDCDFLTIAPHKMFAPTGIGVLYGKTKHLEAMPPFKGGGDMITSVTFEKTTYNKLPFKFEAGTPNIAGVIGLGAAVDYLEAIGMDRIAAHEAELLAYGTSILESIDGLKMIGTARKKASAMSFTMDAAHPHDIGQLLNEEGIAIRAGHHCTQPLMKRFGVPATARASLALYNTKDDLDALGEALLNVNRVFG